MINTMRLFPLAYWLSLKKSSGEAVAKPEFPGLALLLLYGVKVGWTDMPWQAVHDAIGNEGLHFSLTFPWRVFFALGGVAVGTSVALTALPYIGLGVVLALVWMVWVVVSVVAGWLVGAKLEESKTLPIYCLRYSWVSDLKVNVKKEKGAVAAMEEPGGGCGYYEVKGMYWEDVNFEDLTEEEWRATNRLSINLDQVGNKNGQGSPFVPYGPKDKPTRKPPTFTTQGVFAWHRREMSRRVFTAKGNKYRTEQIASLVSMSASILLIVAVLFLATDKTSPPDTGFPDVTAEQQQEASDAR